MSQTLSLEEQIALDPEYMTENEKEFFRTYRKVPGHRNRILQQMQEPENRKILSSLQSKYGFNKARFFGHE